MLKNPTNSLSPCYPSDSVVSDWVIIALGKIHERQSLTTLQTAFYQLPSLETIAELRRMILRPPRVAGILGTYEKEEEVTQDLLSSGNLATDFRNLELLRIWMRGGPLNLDRTGHLRKSNSLQYINLSPSEAKTIAEDVLLQRILKHFDDKRVGIVRSVVNLKTADHSAAMKMLVETIQRRPLSLRDPGSSGNLSNSEFKREDQLYSSQFVTNMYMRLMIKHQNNGQIITSFQKPPLNQYLVEKLLYSFEKKRRYQVCMRFRNVLDKVAVNQSLPTYEGAVADMGYFYAPTCKQNLDSPELFKDALTRLEDSDDEMKYGGSIVLSALDIKIYGRQMVAPIINTFQALRRSKLLEADRFPNYYKSGSYKSLTRRRLIDIFQNLANHDLLSPVDRKKLMPALMSAYNDVRTSPNYNAFQDAPMEHIEILRLIRKLNESEKVDRTAQQRTQQLFYLETGVLGAIGVTAIGLLLSSIRLRNPFSLFFSTYLLFPEEVVAELIALKQRRQTEKVRKWQIRLELAYEIITLIWAFQIQIRIDDRKLPPGGNRSAK